MGRSASSPGLAVSCGVGAGVREGAVVGEGVGVHSGGKVGTTTVLLGGSGRPGPDAVDRHIQHERRHPASEDKGCQDKGREAEPLARAVWLGLRRGFLRLFE